MNKQLNFFINNFFTCTIITLQQSVQTVVQNDDPRNVLNRELRKFQVCFLLDS